MAASSRSRPEPGQDAAGPACAAALAPRALSARARVVAVANGRLRLVAERGAACGACAARRDCGAGALAEMEPAAVLDIAAPPGLQLAPGDEVEVTIPAGRFLGAAGLAYLLPPVVLVTGTAACAALGLGDLATAAACLPLLALSFLPLVVLERRGGLEGALRITAPAAHPETGGSLR